MMVGRAITSTPDLVRLRKSISESSGSSISSSSPLRRRSLIPQTPATNSQNEEQNDDDAERSSLVESELLEVTTSSPHSPIRSRDTMSSSLQKEHFQGCLKLYAENKINKNNAWNLQLIDFMASMLRNRDSRMDDLQTASTVVDASARIYSCRVDAVHYDVLKMAGELSRAAQSKRGRKDDVGCTQDEGAAAGDAAAPTKKKKRAKAAIAANPAVLCEDIEANDFIDPFFERLAATAGDITSANRAFNATLPIHDKTMGLILRTDDRFLEPIEENTTGELDLSERVTIPAKLFPAFTDEDHICEPFTGFSISNWDPETEDTHARVNRWIEDNNRLDLSQQELAFDVNAEVEPVPQEEAHNDIFDDEPLGGIESDSEQDVVMAACTTRAAPAPPPRLTDMRPQAASDSRLEYSYCGAIVDAWAGPRHWRLKNNRVPERTQTTAGRTLKSTKSRTKKQLDFPGLGLEFDSRAKPTGEYEPVQPSKIMISRKTLATSRTWDEANFKMPIDRGLDESHFRKLFLRSRVTLSRKRKLEHHRVEPEPEPMAVDEMPYDYNNGNDASYCANNARDDEWGNLEGAAAAEPPAQAAAAAAVAPPAQAMAAERNEIGDMLEPPAKVAKIFIPYAMRAKKVDMKQLKRCTWKVLTENSQDDKEEVTGTTFATIYNRLPSELSTNMRESLSVPLALFSVLHLANEKGLILEQRDDLKDFDIVGLIKK